MRNPCCALTTPEPARAQCRPFRYTPGARPRFAPNLGARATLHAYHSGGVEVNAESSGRRSVRSDLFLHSQGGNRFAREVLNMRLALRIVNRQGACRARTDPRLFLAAQLGVGDAA